jgi:hypothetical protein
VYSLYALLAFTASVATYVFVPLFMGVIEGVRTPGSVVTEVESQLEGVDPNVVEQVRSGGVGSLRTLDKATKQQIKEKVKKLGQAKVLSLAKALLGDRAAKGAGDLLNEKTRQPAGPTTVKPAGAPAAKPAEATSAFRDFLDQISVETVLKFFLILSVVLLWVRRASPGLRIRSRHRYRFARR